MAKIRFNPLLISLFLSGVFLLPAQAYSDKPVTLEVFYSLVCQKCIKVKNDLMPKIEEEFKGGLLIEYRDIGEVDNYKLLLSLKEKRGKDFKNILPVMYAAGKFLNGDEVNRENLSNFLKRAITARPPEKKEALPSINLVKYFQGFSPIAIASAGLVDGINPCAFTVIVFFISFLALQGYRKRELIVIGSSFIFAVFLTYLMLGLGLFSFLYRLRFFQGLLKLFNLSVGLLSIALGILCIWDFFKFKKTQETEGLVLQLPKAVKNQIHKVIGLHYRIDRAKNIPAPLLARPVISALVTGFLISILEAICTGQVYLPTIAFVLKTTHIKLQALFYLVLYNLMFVLPLIGIFIFALLGVTSGQFAHFFKKHISTIKLLMAFLFFGLGIFLLWRP